MEFAKEEDTFFCCRILADKITQELAISTDAGSLVSRELKRSTYPSFFRLRENISKHHNLQPCTYHTSLKKTRVGERCIILIKYTNNLITNKSSFVTSDSAESKLKLSKYSSTWPLSLSILGAHPIWPTEKLHKRERYAIPLVVWISKWQS